MAIVVQGDPKRAARRAAARPEDLVVSIGPDGPVDGPVTQIGVSVRDKALARRLAGAMTRAVQAAVATPPREIAVVRVRSRRGVDRLGTAVAGALAVVTVTARNRRWVGEIVERLRAGGVAGVQLVWDGLDPPREAAEAPVFAILERARATPDQAPVVLARGREPVEALRILVDRRRR
jgi:hypothetical protein